MKVLGKLSRDNDGLKWEKGEIEMNTIEHDGKTYEVLDPTSTASQDCEFAILGDGTLRSCKYKEDSRGDSGFLVADSWVYFRSMKLLGIQPLRLVPKEPVTFEATFARESTGYWYPLHHLDDGIAYGGKVQRKFRCVEIVEEA
jgi:hypothetical protein